MSFADSVALSQARLAVNAPTLATAGNTAVMGFVQALIARCDDNDATITQSAPNMLWATASGPALAALYTVYVGSPPPQGSPATGPVQFSVQQPAAAPLTIPAGMVVQVPGDGLTTQPIGFATQATDTIPQGGTLSGSGQVERVTITGSPTGGTFTLTHAGQTTAALPYNATAAQVQTALQALSNVGTNTVTGAANVAASGGPLPGTPISVTWQGALNGQTFTTMTAVASLTGGTSPAVAPALVTAVQYAQAQATTNAAAGNVNAGTVTGMATVLQGVSVTNPSAMTGGVDPPSDTQLRAAIQAAVAPKYSKAAIEAAAKSVAGVWDAYLFDAQAGNGQVTLYWSDAFGNQPSALSTLVQAAVATVIPPTVVVTYAAFTIVTLTAVNVTYSAPAAVQSTQIGPAIQAAVAAYVQALVHDQVPDGGNMYLFVQGANGVGYVLTYFALTGTTPAIGSASNTTLYRLVGQPSAVVNLTRA